MRTENLVGIVFVVAISGACGNATNGDEAGTWQETQQRDPCEHLTETQCMCWKLTETECMEHELCGPFAGNFVDEDRGCVEYDSRYAGCMIPDPPRLGGRDSIGWGRDPSGNLWWYPQTPIPSILTKEYHGSMSRCSLETPPPAPPEPCADATTLDCKCSFLTENDCNNSDACTPILGKRVDMSNQCMDDWHFAACGVSQRGCDEAVNWARDPSGELWWFPCYDTPYGWPVADPPSDIAWSCSSEPTDPCPGLTEAECTRSKLTESECIDSKVCGPSTAWHVDAVGNCVEENPQYVACVVLPEACPAALGWARDPSGELWVFPSLCLPPGWPVESQPAGVDWNCSTEP